jgi:cation:H+ antiporter
MSEALFFVGGLVLLVGGAELLVGGAVQIARALGVSALLIGLMVGFGTSTPELVTSVRASLAGAPGIALGNIVGANIANLLLVMGACALVRPIVVDVRSLRLDGAMVLFTVLLFTVLSALVALNRWVGLLYVGLLGAYLYRTWRIERRHPAEHTAPYEKGEAAAEVVPIPARPPQSAGAVVLALSQVVGGVVLVVLGANWLVDAAVNLARTVGVTESVIGLTVVAIGTTLPELVTSLVAARRRNTDVALGNVFGSCIYNILGIAGFSALVAPSVVPPTIVGFGNPLMLLASLLMLGLAWTGYRISRREGLLLLGLYAAYIAATWQT